MDDSMQLLNDYQQAFPSQYFQGPNDISASMKAAADPDPQVLNSVLARKSRSDVLKDRKVCTEELAASFSPNSTVRPRQDLISTPLLQAIRCQLPQNVDTLLEHGAFPNGVDLESLEVYQSLFLRFRPSIPDHLDIDGDVADRKTLMGCMELPQTAPITEQEIERRLHTLTPFWMSPDATALDIFPGGDEMHSLIAAARRPSTQIFDRLVQAGADASAWICTPNQRYDLDSDAPSSIAVANPLQAAIEAVNIPMISHLLALKFDPNFLPLSTPLSCLTPMMTSLLNINKALRDSPKEVPAQPPDLILPAVFNLQAYTAMIGHPLLDLTLTTPILSVHSFHLAVAYGSLPLFLHVLCTLSISPANVAPTALGHTFLHIACLPPSAANIKTNSLAILKSIHDTRSLVYPRSHQIIPPELGTRRPYPSSSSTEDEIVVDCTAQTELVDYLVSALSHKVSEQDIYGNTALHYLASQKAPNTGSISLLRSAEGGECAWSTVRNRWGYSAEDLFSGSNSDEELLQERQTNERYRKAEEINRDEWWSRKLAK